MHAYKIFFVETEDEEAVKYLLGGRRGRGLRRRPLTLGAGRHVKPNLSRIQ